MPRIFDSEGIDLNTRRVKTKLSGQSMTKQADMPETDINKIIARYQNNGDPSIFMRNTNAAYIDASEAPDYFECLNIVKQAQESFQELPAEIRDRFANDPGELITAISDPERWEELSELGILEKDQLKESTEATIAAIRAAFTPPETGANSETPSDNDSSKKVVKVAK